MKYDEMLKPVVEQLVKYYNIYAIILFGSRARGDYHKYSDYDILVIGNFEKPFLDRISDILEILRGIKIPVEVFPYTLDEAISMLKRGSVTIIDALSEGKILYKTVEFEKLQKIFKEIFPNGVKRSKTTIILPKNIEE